MEKEIKHIQQTGRAERNKEIKVDLTNSALFQKTKQNKTIGWTVHEEKGLNNRICYHSIKDNKGQYIASTWGGANLKNASVLAAAPQLLIIAKNLLVYYEAMIINLRDFGHDEEYLQAINFKKENIKKIKAVIKKAEGK